MFPSVLDLLGSHDEGCISCAPVFPKPKLFPADFSADKFLHSGHNYADKDFGYMADKAD